MTDTDTKTEGMPQPNNIDDLLNHNINNRPVNESVESIEPKEPADESVTDSAHEEDETDETDETDKSTKNDKVDDYGNEIEGDEKEEKPEYTKAQLEAMMRDRLERQARSIEQKYQQELQQRQQQPQKQNDDDSGEENWQKAFDNLVNNAMAKREQASMQERYTQMQNQAKQEYEQKIISGSQRFKDFESVTSKVNITQNMLDAGRVFEDPSAFYYAAAKSMPDELNRISKMTDPYAQVAEIARLEGKLRANKGAKSSKAPKPIEKVSGDSAKKESPKKTSIDDLLAAEDAKRLSRRGTRASRGSTR